MQAYGKTESQQNLIFDSRSGSSMDGSLMNSYMSQFTNLTSISSLSSSSSIYSIPSIYRLDDKQISWNKDRPIGEGKLKIEKKFWLFSVTKNCLVYAWWNNLATCFKIYRTILKYETLEVFALFIQFRTKLKQGMHNLREWIQ